MEFRIRCSNKKVVLMLSSMEAVDIYDALMAYDEEDEYKDVYTVLRDEFSMMINTIDAIEVEPPRSSAFIFRSEKED